MSKMVLNDKPTNLIQSILEESDVIDSQILADKEEEKGDFEM